MFMFLPSDVEQVLLHGGHRGDPGYASRKERRGGLVAGDVAHGEPGEGDVHGVVGLHVALELQPVQQDYRRASVSGFSS